jgi:hypothetical protein
MVTISLVVMLGMLGLAVDLGWEFYVHKTARAAADSAALGAVRQARAGLLGTAGPYTCMTSGLTCQPSLVNCGAAQGNLATGCQFAATNGFLDGGIEGRQTLRIQADVGSPGCGAASPPNCVPTAPGVAALYWVHAIATETVPQLFSGILGNTTGVVSADATAALVPIVVPGSIILLNRQFDTSAAGRGMDFSGQGSATVAAPAGVMMASNTGSVGHAGGSSNVTAPFTYIRGAGTADWSYQNGFPDLAFFQDPESGKGQPPLDGGQASRPYIGVPDGLLTSVQCPTGVCSSGNYFATTVVDNKKVATGNPITVSDGLRFDGGTFGSFLFFGGVTFNGSASLGPGRYVLAGVKSGNTLLDIGNGPVSGGSGGDAGRIFILTDSSYGGDSIMSAVVSGVPNKNWSSLGFGDATLKSGNGAFSLYGLDPSLGLPNDLQGFASLVIWQDQRNSTVLYDAEGYVMNSPDCGGDGADRACSNPNQNDPQLTIWGGKQSATTTIAGIVYQPRGAWTQIHSGTSFHGALALITGAIDMQGSPTLDLTGPGLPITTLTSVLVH